MKGIHRMCPKLHGVKGQLRDMTPTRWMGHIQQMERDETDQMDVLGVSGHWHQPILKDGVTSLVVSLTTLGTALGTGQF